ncbi:MAG TPA: outer membrane protein [Thermohalobaculum sp.]|nr:outer membrane protein [Thermohalobaculum sp.]
MRKFGLAVAASVGLCITVSTASASPFEFAGFYAGAHAGYSDASADFSTGALSDKGSMGGLQAGYNFVNGNLLWGIEADISLTGADPKGACPFNAGVTCEVQSGPMGTLRGRLGYAMDDWLIYVTGGAAASRFELNTVAPGGQDSGLHGWTIGIGAEYLLGDIVGVTLEYRYMDFGGFGGIESELRDPTGADIDVDMHVIMGGINFHF